MKKTLPLLLMLSLFLISACVTNKKLTYLQYAGLPSQTADTIVSVTPASYKVLPYDNLHIRVITPDPQWAVMFNTMPVTNASVSVTEQSADLISYPVDSSGSILLPYAGKLSVSGKTLDDISSDVEIALKRYIADPSVSVKMINNYVSLIGEVNMPGRYPIYKDRLNIFQALAMGGDLSEFSDRHKVQIIRQVKGGNIIKEFCLTDRTIMTSEFYYVMPNDVIYAMPIKGRFFKMNEFPYTIILSAVTTFVLLWNVVK